MTRFVYRVQNLLAEQGKVMNDLQSVVGVQRKTIYKCPKKKPTIAAIAYYLGVSAEELVAGTDAEETWNKDTSGY